jgi:hypothetical protein
MNLGLRGVFGLYRSDASLAPALRRAETKWLQAEVGRREFLMKYR